MEGAGVTIRDELDRAYCTNRVHDGLAPHTRKSCIKNHDGLVFTREQVKELLARYVIGTDVRAEVICPLDVAPKKGPKRFRLIHNVRTLRKY